MKYLKLFEQYNCPLIRVEKGESYNDIFLGKPKDFYRGGRQLEVYDDLGYIYFTDSEQTAQQYADTKENLPVYHIQACNILDLTNNREKIKHIIDKEDLDTDSLPFALSHDDRLKLINYAKKHNYDCLKFRDTDIGNKNIITSWVVFSKENVVSL